MYYVSAFKNNALFNFIKGKTSAMCALSMNLHKSTLIIIVMHVNMFDVSYDIA